MIDPAKHAWQAPNAHHGSISAKLGIEFTGAREARANGAPSSQGAIEFFPDGAATGGRIRLTAGSAAWDIDVAWLTGQVKVRQGIGEAMMRPGRIRHARPARMRGYTLIEVIVAFALLALALTLLLGSLTNAARQVHWADGAGRATLVRAIAARPGRRR